MNASQANTSSPAKAPPTFLTIAGELRNQIYSYLLAEDTIFYPYDNKPCSRDCPKHHRHDPNVSILAVNKQTNVEATPILYSNATFRLTTGHNLLRFLNKGEHICIFQSPALESIYPSRHFIRNLQIKFIPEHTPVDFRDQRNADLWGDPIFRTKTRAERAQLLHDSDRDLSETVWLNAGVSIPRLKGLKALTLDIEQCFCPMGCCRMTSQVIASVEGMKTRKGIELVVVGCLVPGEEQKIRKALKCVYDPKPTKPDRDPLLDAQHIRDVFEGLYSSSESDGEDDVFEDVEDSEEDDDDESDDEDDSEEDEEDSDEDDDDDSNDSKTSGDIDEDVPVAKADVEVVEASLCGTEGCSPSEDATKASGFGPSNESSCSSTEKSTANSLYDKAALPTTTSSCVGPAATDETDSVRVLSSEDARRLIVTVNPTSSAINSDNHSAAQRHNHRRLSKRGKVAMSPSNEALLESNPTLSSLAVPSLAVPSLDGPSASSNYDSNTDDLIDLSDPPDLDFPPTWSTSQHLDQEL